MEAGPTLNSIQTPKPRVSAILVLIAIFFIADISFQIFSSLFLLCLFGCNDFDRVHLQEAYLMGGLLILALIEAVGLFKRLHWARIFGIVLAILLFLPHVIGDFQFGFPFSQSLVSFVTNPFDIIPALIVLYLVIPYFNKNWIRHGNRSIIIALILSISALILFGINLQNYNQVITPALKAQRAGEQAKIQGIVKAGTVYADAEYGFQLTFPNDRTVSKSEYTMAATTHVQTSLEFSGKNYLGENAADTFYVDVSDIFPGQETLDSIISQGLKSEPRDSWSKGEFNNIPYAKDSDWIRPDRSFHYVILRNGKKFKFADRGGMPASQFDSIMQTLKFAN